jgi:TolA-binding protein
MRGFDCARTLILLERRISGLEEPDRLLLEEHLASCKACRRDQDALDRIVSLTEAAAQPLRDSARERAIERAFERPRPLREQKPVRLPGWRRVAMAAALVLVTVVVLVFALRDRSQALRGGGLARFTIGQMEPAPRPSLVGGSVQIQGRVAPAPASIEPEAVFSAEQTATLVANRARLELRAGSQASFSKDARTLRLKRGSVRVELDAPNLPTENARFNVATDRFRVEVVGTVFEVELDKVRVIRGKVRVVDAETNRALANVAAGQSWTPPGSGKAEPAVTPSAAASTTGQRGVVVGELLGQARGAIAKGDTRTARAAIAKVLAAKTSRAERAEAETLLAECALVEGDHKSAARSYARVVREHSGTPAAESALFAAARSELEAGHPDRAKQLFQIYLARHPDGRFSKEARARLAALEQR